MLKKVTLTLSALAFMTISAMTAPQTVFASPQEAVAAAKAEVPATCVMYGYKEEDGKSIINFRDNENYLDYDVEVNVTTNKVLEVDIIGSNISGSTNVVKTEEDIKAIILEAYPDAKNIQIKKEVEGNNTHYEADFSTEKYTVEAELNPVTGAFAKRELEYFQK